MSILTDTLHEIKMAFVLFSNAFGGLYPVAETTEATLAAGHHGKLAIQGDSSAVEAKEPHTMRLIQGSDQGAMARRAYEYRHIVGFEETNLVGNVYYVNHLRWQGRCRELFLREHAPEMLTELSQDLCLVTIRCACEYLAELEVFDEVVIRMYLGTLKQNRLSLVFEYWRCTGVGEECVARGEQQVACMRREREHFAPAPFPKALLEVMRPYVKV
jgi:enediyne biosynthesis thioesterase